MLCAAKHPRGQYTNWSNHPDVVNATLMCIAKGDKTAAIIEKLRSDHAFEDGPLPSESTIRTWKQKGYRTVDDLAKSGPQPYIPKNEMPALKAAVQERFFGGHPIDRREMSARVLAEVKARGVPTLNKSGELHDDWWKRLSKEAEVSMKAAKHSDRARATSASADTIATWALAAQKLVADRLAQEPGSKLVGTLHHDEKGFNGDHTKGRTTLSQYVTPYGFEAPKLPSGALREHWSLHRRRRRQP